jgi:hypothetical protein
MVQDQAGQKVFKTPISINKKLGVVVHACYHSYAGSLNRKIIVQASLQQMQNLMEK